MRHAIILGVASLSLWMIGCASTAYLVPNYDEYTTGGIFADKYWSYVTGGKRVKLEGKYGSVRSTVVSGVEQLVFNITVPNGKDVDVYAGRDVATQLFKIKGGERVSVYGETVVLRRTSRIDTGLVGKELAVKLHRLEISPSQ